jgi:hypothetical protein
MHKKSAVLTFIEKERGQGTSDQEIRHHLLDAGWQMDIINRAMGGELTKSSPKPPKPRRKKRLSDKQMWLLGLAILFVVLVLFSLFI